MQEVTDETEHSSVFRMRECRVQTARERDGRPLFPCKSVGEVEYAGFAAAIDSRIKCECIACPPDDEQPGFHCAWRFSLVEQ